MWDRRLRPLATFALLTAALAALLASAPVHANDPGDFQVIVHPDNPESSMTRDGLADALLKTVTRWGDGETIRPVDLRRDSAVRRKFSESVLKRSVAAVRSYWQQRIFSGRDVPPPELDSDDAVVGYVLAHRGGLGYVAATTRVREAKVILVR
jgi:ABC-type phosphate transport system substrate-binding protein